MAKTPADIRSLARSHTKGAIKVLAGIMNEPKAAHAARVSAAVALLDRGWGKPKQELTVETRRTFSEMTDAELESIARGTPAGSNGASDPQSGPEPSDSLH